jgi:hypothetical protein
MLVKVIGRALPNVGPVGAVRKVPANEARVLIAIGRVEAYEPAEKPKRVYKRKDMVAEVVEVAQVEVAPVAEPVEEAAEEVSEDGDK